MNDSKANHSFMTSTFAAFALGDSRKKACEAFTSKEIKIIRNKIELEPAPFIRFTEIWLQDAALYIWQSIPLPGRLRLPSFWAQHSSVVSLEQILREFA